MLKQLQKTPENDLHIRLYWPGRGPHTQHTLSALRTDLNIADQGREKVQVREIEICLVRELGGRFAQSKNFIKDLETAVPDFYENVMQYLKAWQPPAPRMREGRSDASDVTPAALAATVEVHQERTISTPIPLNDHQESEPQMIPPQTSGGEI